MGPTPGPTKCVHIDITQDYGAAHADKIRLAPNDVDSVEGVGTLPFYDDVAVLLKYAGW
jgi:hypothetical protein